MARTDVMRVGAGRDRGVDGLRAGAIAGVVLGHWLVTALVADGSVLRTASPLRYMPWLTPASWALQTLAVFFMVGGHVGTRGYLAAVGRGESYGQWLTGRLSRLSRPVTALLAFWASTSALLIVTGTGPTTVGTLLELALSPLWFLAVYAVLTAATPLLLRLSPMWPLAVVLHVDLLRFGFGAPSWTGWINVAAGWAVPYTLGAAWTRGELESRRAGWILFTGGAATTAGLVAWAGYPASMVGVPGAAVSNLDPPTLAAVTFGLAQCGLALLLHGRLDRALRRPWAWAAVRLVNLSAMTVYLWHLTALTATTATALLAGRLPGLHTLPDSPGWLAARLAWFPVLALALTVCWAVFRPYEQVPAVHRATTARRGPDARQRADTRRSTDARLDVTARLEATARPDVTTGPEAVLGTEVTIGPGTGVGPGSAVGGARPPDRPLTPPNRCPRTTRPPSTRPLRRELP